MRNKIEVFAALSAFIADIGKQIDTFAEKHSLEPCKTRTAVAAQILDDMMNSGHSACAQRFAISAALEAQSRYFAEHPEIEAVAEKAMSNAQEH